jgi:hypothetical protein
VSVSSFQAEGSGEPPRPRWKVTAPDVVVPHLPDAAPLRAATKAVLDRWPDKLQPPKMNLEQLVAEMLDRVNRWDFSKWTIAQTINAAHACFDASRRGKPDLAPLRRFYHDEIVASTNESFLDGMMPVFIGSFVPESQHTLLLGRALASARARLGPRWTTLLKALPSLFDGRSAPRQIATMMTNMGDPWTELQQIGIRLPHAPGLMDHAHSAFVSLMAPRLNKLGDVDKLVAWLKPEGQPVRSSGGAEAIQALLAHWTDKEPPEALRKRLVERLTDLFGDPRMHKGGAWAGISGATLNLFLRWITGANIEFFMDVVTQVEQSRMWIPRRRFWMQLYMEGRIDAAWVAFSERGVTLANRLLYAQGRRDRLEFGKQVAREDTSILILKSGDKIIVEGSHSYRIHIFRETEPEAPKLYQNSYNCDEILRKSDLRKNKLARTHSCQCSRESYPEICLHNCGWQDWVNEHI